ncbi:hypothetical protein BBB44_04115 [Bordetella bronchiseptica]|nr:hypothetical protein BBB44_04115 [Bordetella bronchiseptica]
MLKRRWRPSFLIPYRVAKHLQKHAPEQIVELLQVLFALGDQPFHFAKQMGNADLVFEFFGDGDFEFVQFFLGNALDSRARSLFDDLFFQ